MLSECHPQRGSKHRPLGFSKWFLCVWALFLRCSSGEMSGPGRWPGALADMKWPVTFCSEVVWPEESGRRLGLGHQVDRVPDNSWERRDLPLVWFYHCVVLWLITCWLTFLCPDFLVCNIGWSTLVFPSPKDDFNSVFIKSSHSFKGQHWKSKVVLKEQEPGRCRHFRSLVLK